MLGLIAYLDPGSGSLLVQLILGGFGAVLVALRLFWRYLRAPFLRASETEAPNPSPSE